MYSANSNICVNFVSFNLVQFVDFYPDYFYFFSKMAGNL